MSGQPTTDGNGPTKATPMDLVVDDQGLGSKQQSKENSTTLSVNQAVAGISSGGAGKQLGTDPAGGDNGNGGGVNPGTSVNPANNSVAAGGGPEVHGSAGSSGDLSDQDKLARQLERDEKKAAEKTRRVKTAKMLWPTSKRYEEYTSQSGRDSDPDQQHIHVAHLMNCPGFVKVWNTYLAAPGGGSESSKLLKKAREAAVQFSFTKEKKKAANEAKVEEEQRQAAERKAKAKGRRRSPSPSDKGKGKGKSSGSRLSRDKEEAGGKKPKSGSRATTPAASKSSKTPSSTQQQQRPSSVKRDRPESTESTTSTSHQSQKLRTTSPLKKPVKERLGFNIPRRNHSAPAVEKRRMTAEEEDADTLDLNIDEAEVFDDDKEEPKGHSAAESQKDDDTFATAAKQPGKWRVIVQGGHDGLTNITKGMWEKFKTRFSSLVAEQQEDLDQDPILVEDFWSHGGRIVIEPADQESRDLIVALVKDKIQVNGVSFLPQLSKDMAPTASLSFRVESPGKADTLLCCPKRGICRLNRWDPGMAQGIRIVGYPDRDTGIRFIRAACTEEVVTAIKKKGGSIYCGVGRASVQWQKHKLQEGVEVTFRQQ